MTTIVRLSVWLAPRAVAVIETVYLPAGVLPLGLPCPPEPLLPPAPAQLPSPQLKATATHARPSSRSPRLRLPAASGRHASAPASASTAGSRPGARCVSTLAVDDPAVATPSSTLPCTLIGNDDCCGGLNRQNACAGSAPHWKVTVPLAAPSGVRFAV